MEDQSKKEIWVSLVGPIDIALAQRFAGLFTNAAADRVTHLHLLIQSPGGTINEGVFIFNFLHGYPIPVTAYNNGNVSSAATTAYLGAKRRVVSSDATFLIHRTRANPGIVGHASNLVAITDSINIDDARTTEILKASCKLTQAHWDVFQHSDLTLDAQAAIDTGIAHGIGRFAPAGPMFFI